MMDLTFYAVTGLCSGYLLNALTNYFLYRKKTTVSKEMLQKAEADLEREGEDWQTRTLLQKSENERYITLSSLYNNLLARIIELEGLQQKSIKEPKPKKTVKEEAQLCALALNKAIEHLEAGLKGPVTDKTPYKQTTGQVLKELRRTNEMSQREVAKKANTSLSALSRLECDYRPITKKQAKKLAAVFNIPYKDLMKK